MSFKGSRCGRVLASVTWAGVVGKVEHPRKSVEAVADRNINRLSKYAISFLTVCYDLH